MLSTGKKELSPISRFLIDRNGLPGRLVPGFSADVAARLRREFQDDPKILAQIDLLTRTDLIRGSYFYPDEKE